MHIYADLLAIHLVTKDRGIVEYLIPFSARRFSFEGEYDYELAEEDAQRKKQSVWKSSRRLSLTGPITVDGPGAGPQAALVWACRWWTQSLQGYCCLWWEGRTITDRFDAFEPGTMVCRENIGSRKILAESNAKSWR